MFLQCRAAVFVKIAVSWAQIKKTKKAKCGSLSFTRHKCIFCFKNKRLDWIWRLASNPTSIFDPFFAWLRVVSRRLRALEDLDAVFTADAKARILAEQWLGRHGR
jgi:hypothetical protein